MDVMAGLRELIVSRDYLFWKIRRSRPNEMYSVENGTFTLEIKKNRGMIKWRENE